MGLINRVFNMKQIKFKDCIKVIFSCEDCGVYYTIDFEDTNVKLCWCIFSCEYIGYVSNDKLVSSIKIPNHCPLEDYKEKEEDK